MAHFSEDPSLVAAFQNGEKFHDSTASRVSHVPLAAVTSEQRRQAKTVNVGLIYGMSAFGLRKQLMISRQEATDLIDR